jgi:crotonobetainyl-CoA:carnitine CoA-transferase CaiB-like acyl-CoA transferase
MMIGVAGQGIWEGAAKALGHAEWLEGPRFLRGANRMSNRAVLERELTAVCDKADSGGRPSSEAGHD